MFSKANFEVVKPKSTSRKISPNGRSHYLEKVVYYVLISPLVCAMVLKITLHLIGRRVLQRKIIRSVAMLVSTFLGEVTVSANTLVVIDSD